MCVTPGGRCEEERCSHLGEHRRRSVGEPGGFRSWEAGAAAGRTERPAQVSALTALPSKRPPSLGGRSRSAMGTEGRSGPVKGEGG